jgi:hypothetical protein
MDTRTFVTALLTVAVFGLAIVVGLAHRDMTRAVDRMDGAVNRMDSAVNRMDRAAAACERAAAACVRLADAVVQLVRDRRGDQPAQ